MRLVRALLLSWIIARAASAAIPAPATSSPTTMPAITTLPANGIVTSGQKVEWKVQVTDLGTLTYRVQRNGAEVIDSGPVPVDGIIQSALAEPGTLLLDLLGMENGKETTVRSAGVAVSPEKIAPAAEAPADFDVFWALQLAHLKPVSRNPQLKREPSGRTGVDYWTVSLDNVDGKHVRGQLARPAGDKKMPAMVVYQWAGVYGLQKSWVSGPAAEGWLVLNVSAHDLPIDRDEAFYEQQRNGTLKDYVRIGATSRETSYFRTMLLGDYQAIEYLTHRPDWDGRTLIVRGESQGGLQAIAMAGLHPKVTALAVCVPAGCDTFGKESGRKPGWPYWFGIGDTDSHAKIMETSRYFDTSNFARRVTCPAFVGMGLCDTTAPPAGVFGMYNVLRGPKQIVVDPYAVHRGSKTRFDPQQKPWLKAQLRRTGSD